MKNEIEIINNIVLQAIKHGADNGGSYENNGEELKKAIEKYIINKKWLFNYEVKHTTVCENGEMWGTYKIIKKGIFKNGN